MFEKYRSHAKENTHDGCLSVGMAPVRPPYPQGPEGLKRHSNVMKAWEKLRPLGRSPNAAEEKAKRSRKGKREGKGKGREKRARRRANPNALLDPRAEWAETIAQYVLV